MASIKPEFLIDRQGKQFVLYAGLLDLAHQDGLRTIRTRLVQIPSEDNNQVAICHAEVETSKGLFSGIGDASPSNVSRAMLTATIRFAETRAKARALRDAVNVGVAALEELDTDDEPNATPATGQPSPQAVNTSASQAAPSATSSTAPSGQQARQPSATALATQPQVNAIYSIALDLKSMNKTQIDAHCRQIYGKAPAELTRQEASQLISALKG